ncbi:MAG: hypothetical protein QM762_05870 [Chryseolinea sp.]
MIRFCDAFAVGGTSMTVKQEAVEKPAAMINPRTWFNTARDPSRIYGKEDSSVYLIIEEAELTASL